MRKYYKVNKMNMIFNVASQSILINKDKLIELLKTSTMYKFEVKFNEKNKSLVEELRSDGLISDKFKFEKTIYLNWCNNKLEIN